MAATVTRLTPSTTISGTRGTRAGRRDLEIYTIVLTTPTTTATISASPLKQIFNVQLIQTNDSDVSTTPAITNSAAGASAAFTGLTTDTTYIALVKGTHK